MSGLHVFMLGTVATLSVVAGLFFIRDWRASGDRLYLWFAIAFGMLSANWATVALTTPTAETRHWAYVLRLVAFLLIVGGIADKNRKERP